MTTPKTTPAELDAWLDEEASCLLHRFVADFRERFCERRQEGVWDTREEMANGGIKAEFRSRLETLKPLLRLDVQEPASWVVICYTPATWDVSPPYPEQNHLFPVPPPPYNGTVHFETSFHARDAAIASAVNCGTHPDNQRHFVVRAALAPCAEVMRIAPEPKT